MDTKGKGWPELQERVAHSQVSKSLHPGTKGVGGLNLLLAFNGVCKLYSKKGRKDFAQGARYCEEYTERIEWRAEKAGKAERTGAEAGKEELL